MGIGELFLLAVGLSMDAFAVSVCKGLAMKKATLKAEATCGLWFGGFQMLMPVTGFFLGSLFAEAIEAFDHWVAFGLLVIIGINMLKEALEKEDESGRRPGKGRRPVRQDHVSHGRGDFHRRAGRRHFPCHGRQREHLAGGGVYRYLHLPAVRSGREDRQRVRQPV